MLLEAFDAEQLRDDRLRVVDLATNWARNTDQRLP